MNIQNNWFCFKIIPNSRNYYFYDLNARLNHKFGDRSRLYLGFYGGKDHFHYHSVTTEENRLHNRDKTGMDWGNLIGYARWNYVPASKLFVNLTLAYNRYRMTLAEDMDNRYYVPEGDWSGETYNARFRSGIRDWSVRADFDYTPSVAHGIRFGAEFLHHLFTPGVSTAHARNAEGSTVVQDSAYYTGISRPQRGMEASVYAEDSWQVNGRFSLNYGLRLTWFHTQGKSYLSAQPRVAARYGLGAGWAVKAAYSRMSQYVHLLSSTPLSMPTDLWVPITRDILPMYADQYAVGGYYAGVKGWEFSAEAYCKLMNHVLEYRDGVSFFGSSANWESKVVSGRGRAYRVELMVKRTAGRTTGWLAYTLGRSERRFPDGSINYGRWFPHKYDRRHSLYLCVNHKFGERMDLAASWVLYTGGCLTVPERRTVVITPDGNIEEADYIPRRNNYRLPVSHRLNIGMNFHRKTRHGMRTWSVGLYNVYNAMNPNLMYYERKDGRWNYVMDGNGDVVIRQEPGQTVIKKLTLLPCIPSVTYTYRF